MALFDQNPDDAAQKLITGSSFLGKPVSIDLPGTVATLSTGGPPSLPGVPSTGGIAGMSTPPSAGASAKSAGGGPSGGSADLFAKIAAGLGLGEKGADLIAKLSAGDLARGNVGGEGTPQKSDQSLSDQVRSALGGGAGLPFGPGSSFTPGSDVLKAFERTFRFW